MNPISSVTGKQYGMLLNSIQQICLESNIEIEKKNAEAFEESLKGSGYYHLLPNMQMSDVQKTISKFVKNQLVLYAAAKKVPLNPIADAFLLKWVEGMEDKIQRKIVSLEPICKADPFDKYYVEKSMYIKRADFVKVEKKLNKMVEKVQWPICPEINEKALCDAFKLPLGKEIVFRHFHPQASIEVVPEHVSPYILKVFLSMQEHHLVTKYSGLINNICIKDITLNNPVLELYLNRFAHLDSLDLTNCVNISKYAFSKGHPTLKSIILNGTSVRKGDLNKELFPSLEEIYDKYVNIVTIECKFSGLSSGLKQSWEELIQLFEEADVIRGNNLEFHLLEKFKKLPCSKGVKALLCYETHGHKNKEFNKGYSRKMFDAFFEAMDSAEWHSAPLSKFQAKIIGLVIKRWSKEENLGIQQIIHDIILSELTLTDNKCSSNKLSRIRWVLVTCGKYDIKFSTVFVHNLIARLKTCYNTLEQKTGFSKNIYGGNPCDETVALIEILNEIYAAITHHLPEKNLPGAPTLLLNFSYPLYKSQTNHMLACAFAQKMPVHERILMLRNVLQNFSDYVCDPECHYSLPKILLGAIESDDVPLWDKSSRIFKHLKFYAGIFSEPIDEELKGKYWKKILSGKLGGHTIELIDALVIFYQKPSTTPEQKQDILTALKTFGRVTTAVKGFNTYAKKKRKELKSI